MPGAKIEIVQNGSPSQQHSLLIDNEHAVAIARFLRVDPALRLDFCSNVTGVDWLDRVVKKTMKIKKLAGGQEKEIVETTEEKIPGYVEAVYHLYSMTHKHGPVIIRTRTSDRADGAHLPSLTSIWRSAEFQEREIFDLYGVRFDGHPDLRRILMWEGYPYHPLRKDFPLAGKPTDLPGVAFTKVTPMEGGPFVTLPSADDSIAREPRVRVPEGAERAISDKRRI